MNRLRWIGLTLLGLLGLIVVAVLVPLRRVEGSDMAWTLQPGEHVWIVPDRVRKADVVAVIDPLDPARVVLRRAVAAAGESVSWEDATLRINGKRVRQSDMGDVAGWKVVEETIWSRPPARANKFLPRFRPSLRAPWKQPGKVTVPEGHWYLLADSRDGALDSRFWGPVPESAIEGVARAWVGAADTWRPGRFALLLPEE